jgi:D-sedoheptulose 7-phosphate isomerase
MRDSIKNEITETARLLQRVIDENVRTIAEGAEVLVRALKGGNKILVFGNGGSAADAQHMVCELVGRFRRDRAPIPAMALTTNSSSLTAIANDYGFDQIFSRQVQALARPGDVCLAISTSGSSTNVLNAVRTANDLGLETIGLSGKEGGELATLCSLCICVPSDSTPRIQEAHITIIHALCRAIEQELFGAA